METVPSGFTTLTLAVPIEAVRLAGIDAVSCVALTNAVANAFPFHCRIDPDTNPEPTAVSVRADPPAAAELGLRLLNVSVAVIVNGTGADAAPPGLITVTLAVPAEAIRIPVTEAVS